jgi:hypothetical protein
MRSISYNFIDNCAYEDFFDVSAQERNERSKLVTSVL